jgi:gliding motility-associated-like protein
MHQKHPSNNLIDRHLGQCHFNYYLVYMKYYSLAVLILLLASSCNRNNDDEVPLCQISANPYYTYNYGYYLMIPNAFTPNGDGRNDRFRPLGDSTQLTNYRMTIVDRSGSTIFETTSVAGAWDGRNTAGIIMSPGRYIAKVSYRKAYNEMVNDNYCISLLSYSGRACIPQSVDGSYYFEDMYDPYNQSFRYNTGESICY